MSSNQEKRPSEGFPGSRSLVAVPVRRGLLGKNGGNFIGLKGLRGQVEKNGRDGEGEKLRKEA